MHPRLEAVRDDLDAALARLHELQVTVPQERWTQRRDANRWSVAECVAHLNLTSAAFVPLLHAGIAEARALGGGAPARYRRDPVGWLLWRSMPPPARMRVGTPAAFVPGPTPVPGELVSAFESWHAKLVACAVEGDGLPLQRVRIASPFEARLRYNLFSALTIVPRHQHRHLWQAEQLWKSAEA